MATYDLATQEFVIETRGDEANKDYIGNAAEHAELAVVFAQLEVGGKSEGVHAFVVRIREKGKVVPGVRIEDDGQKMGLNGVDNGRIWFDGVRVPRTALLNQFADVTPAGVYESEIDNPNKRFFTMLGTLVQGRVCVGGGGINAAKVALAIAVKYALQPAAVRGDQRGAGGAAPRLRHAPAAAVPAARPHLRAALRPGGRRHPAPRGLLRGRADTEHEKNRRELESRAAGTKALGTWHATRTIQECREACGGAGYLSVNRFAALKADTDVFTTFEGDNTVLLQLVAKGLLTDYASEFEDLDQFGMVRYVAGLGSRRCSRRPASTSCSSGSRTCCPAATRAGTRRPGCSTRSTSSRCTASARTTCSAAWPAASSAASTTR